MIRRRTMHCMACSLYPFSVRHWSQRTKIEIFLKVIDIQKFLNLVIRHYPNYMRITDQLQLVVDAIDNEVSTLAEIFDVGRRLWSLIRGDDVTGHDSTGNSLIFVYSGLYLRLTFTVLLDDLTWFQVTWILILDSNVNRSSELQSIEEILSAYWKSSK